MQKGEKSGDYELTMVSVLFKTLKVMDFLRNIKMARRECAVIVKCSGPRCEKHVFIGEGERHKECECGKKVDRKHHPKSRKYATGICIKTRHVRPKTGRYNLCFAEGCGNRFRDGCTCAPQNVLDAHAVFLSV